MLRSAWACGRGRAIFFRLHSVASFPPAALMPLRIRRIRAGGTAASGGCDARLLTLQRPVKAFPTHPHFAVQTVAPSDFRLQLTARLREGPYLNPLKSESKSHEGTPGHRCLHLPAFRGLPKSCLHGVAGSARVNGRLVIRLPELEQAPLLTPHTPSPASSAVEERLTGNHSLRGEQPAAGISARTRPLVSVALCARRYSSHQHHLSWRRVPVTKAHRLLPVALERVADKAREEPERWKTNSVPCADQRRAQESTEPC